VIYHRGMFARSLRPPSAEEIGARFGFPPPPRFVELLQFIHAETGEVAGGDGSYVQSILGMYLCADDMRYDQTPPELFPFAHPGTDGIHVGYVIHDPRLGPDFPVGCLDPMSGVGVRHVGHDTASGFDLLLSQMLESDVSPGEAVRIARVAELLGVSPSAEKAAQAEGWGFGPPGDGLPPMVPNAPSGWRHAETADGVGVLAPEDAFCPSAGEHGPPKGAEDWRDRAERRLKAGTPASALVVLRNAVWGDKASPAEVSSLLQRAYLHLGRPLLADVARRHGARRR
jgi:hypothetical protein